MTSVYAEINLQKFLLSLCFSAQQQKFLTQLSLPCPAVILPVSILYASFYLIFS